jgi:hypothetical protein
MERRDENPGDSRNRGGATTEVVDVEMAAVLRVKSPRERLEIGFGLFRHASRFLTEHLRSTHPEWTVERLNREVAQRLSDGSW